MDSAICSGPKRYISESSNGSDNLRSVQSNERTFLIEIQRSREAAMQSDFMGDSGPIETLHSLDTSEAASERVAPGSDCDFHCTQ